MSQETIITIGRQYGSGGRNIGIQLAKELGVPFYDQNILKQAEQRAQQLMSKEEVYILAENEANEMIKNAQLKIKELKQATNEYVDDALRRTEESISTALNEIKASRSSFMALTNNQPKQPSPIIEDI